MVDADQDSLNFLLSVTKLQRDFFLTVGPLPPVLKISYFRKLAIVNSLLFGDVNLLPLSCQFYNSEMSFSRT